MRLFSLFLMLLLSQLGISQATKSVGYEAIALKKLTLFDSSFGNATTYEPGSRIIVATLGSSNHSAVSPSNAILAVRKQDIQILRALTFEELEKQVQAFASISWISDSDLYSDTPSPEAMSLQNLYVRRVKQRSPGSLPRASSESTADSTSIPKVEVINDTDFKLYVYFSGTQVKAVTILPKTMSSFTLQAGSYSVVAKSSKTNVRAFYGSDEIKNGYIHSHKFYIVTRKV